MANPEHVKILKQGVKVWNRWREENPDIVPDLRVAYLGGLNLSNAVLSGADLTNADLSQAKLNGANLVDANLFEAIIRDASLSWANFCRANLRRADLNYVDLENAILVEANLIDAHLLRANLQHANLERASLVAAHADEADFTAANLSRADLNYADFMSAKFYATVLTGALFESAYMGSTALNALDLSEAKGLESVKHGYPSSLGIDTIIMSKGKIPEVFLRGVGLPDAFIENIPALLAAGEAIQYYSCFISYSSMDEEFAKRLYADLQAKGVRCWFAPEDLKIGDKTRIQIEKSIQVNDRLLLILSEDSVKSKWVEHEVETAFDKELRECRMVLFPIRLDDAAEKSKAGWAGKIWDTRNIGDFRCWKKHDDYQKAFDRLLKDLKAKEKPHP